MGETDTDQIITQACIIGVQMSAVKERYSCNESFKGDFSKEVILEQERWRDMVLLVC